MTSRDFCYWLQGYFEISRPNPAVAYDRTTLSADQIDCIRKHLAMVFYHEIDPSFGPSNPGLGQIHHGGGTVGSSPFLDAIAKC